MQGRARTMTLSWPLTAPRAPRIPDCAGAGGATGTLVGALIGAGIPEERVKHYEKGLQSGGILLGVRPRSDDDAGYFDREWNDAGGTHVNR